MKLIPKTKGIWLLCGENYIIVMQTIRVMD